MESLDLIEAGVGRGDPDQGDEAVLVTNPPQALIGAVECEDPQFGLALGDVGLLEAVGSQLGCGASPLSPLSPTLFPDLPIVSSRRWFPPPLFTLKRRAVIFAIPE